MKPLPCIEMSQLRSETIPATEKPGLVALLLRCGSVASAQASEFVSKSGNTFCVFALGWVLSTLR